MGAVYHRRPTPYATRFGQLPAQQREFAVAEARHGLGGVLRSLYPALFVNHPSAVTRAEFKPWQLRRFAELGLRVPATLVTNDVEEARRFASGVRVRRLQDVPGAATRGGRVRRRDLDPSR
ncbi:hypothetical protein LV779_04110 [Streptomyces thinghirensis]|nr:hypothetical protein [Streptomyces thinghirensis]